MMKRLRGTSTRNSPMNRDTAPRPGDGVKRIYANHGGTNLPQGKVREVPTLPMVNAANYAGKKRK